MRVRSEFNVLGIIKSYASNGLSIFESSQKGKKEVGQISGGAIGDIVAYDLENKATIIIDSNEWEKMPKDKKARSELMAITNESIDELRIQIANLKAENLDLKNKIAQLEAKKSDELVLKGDENAK